MINEEYAFFAILKRYCDKKEWTVPTAQIENTLEEGEEVLSIELLRLIN